MGELVRFSDRLDGLRNIEKGWDGYRGLPPTEHALATAANIQVIPMSCGGVNIEMHAGGADVEITIRPDGIIESVSWSMS